MPRGRRLRDYLMRRDGRNPYGSRGGYVVSSRRDRASEDYGYGREYPGYDMSEYNSRQSDRAYNEQGYERSRRDYEYGGQYDMARMDYGEMRGDMHYGERQGNFRPVEAMGYFQGYYGGGQDYARGGRGRDYGDYNYYMRGRGRDYGYDYAGDFGENLTKEELEHWKKKLMEEVEDKDKQFFTRENLSNKARQMGVDMKKFNEDEFMLTALMMYTDYCKTLGTANMDTYLRLAKDWLEDKDVAVKGGEKLAVYYDCIVEGEDD